MTAELLAGRDVMIDAGLRARSSRDAARARATDAGAVAQLYWLRCLREVMRQRTLERTDSNAPDSLWIDNNAFDVR